MLAVCTRVVTVLCSLGRFLGGGQLSALTLLVVLLSIRCYTVPGKSCGLSLLALTCATPGANLHWPTVRTALPPVPKKLELMQLV